MSTRALIQALQAMTLKREVMYLHVGQDATEALLGASIVAAVGAASPTASALPIATATRPVTASTTWAFGSAGRYDEQEGSLL